MTETVVHRLQRPWCDNKDDDDSGHECYAGIGVELSMYKPEQHTTGDHPGAVTWEGPRVVILALSHDDKRGEYVELCIGDDPNQEVRLAIAEAA
jgi:hypothetical protein